MNTTVQLSRNAREGRFQGRKQGMIVRGLWPYDAYSFSYANRKQAKDAKMQVRKAYGRDIASGLGF